MKVATTTHSQTNYRALETKLWYTYTSEVIRHKSENEKKIQKWVARGLNDQQLTWFDTYRSLLVRLKNYPFLDRLLNVEEKWFFMIIGNVAYLPLSSTTLNLHPQLKRTWYWNGLFLYIETITSEAQLQDALNVNKHFGQQCWI